MKSFLSHNWYKLMIASSFLIFSIGFLLYAISPSYANTNEEKINTSINSPNSNDDRFAVSSNGYLYVFDNKNVMYSWAKGEKYYYDKTKPEYQWKGNELISAYGTASGYKMKLP